MKTGRRKNIVNNNINNNKSNASNSNHTSAVRSETRVEFS